MARSLTSTVKLDRNVIENHGYMIGLYGIFWIQFRLKLMKIGENVIETNENV